MGANMCSDQSCPSVKDLNDVCTFQSALRSCDPDLLLDVLLDTEAGWGISYRNVGSNAKMSLLEKLASTIALMLSVGDKGRSLDTGGANHSQHFEFAPPGYSNTQPVPPNKMIVPFETFSVSNDGHSFIRRLDARLLDCSRLEEAMRVIRDIGGKVRLMPEHRHQPILKNGIDPFEMAMETGLLEDICVLEDEQWSATMQRKIWLPRTYCERERYCILASVFWTITYNGFFGNAADKIIGRQDVSPIPLETLDSFDDDYKDRLFEIASLMNYNGWVDSIESLTLLCEAA